MRNIWDAAHAALLTFALSITSQHALAEDAPAAAKSCTLTQLASYKITAYSNGVMSIPVDVSGSIENMLLDPDVETSAVTTEFVRSFAFPTETVSPGVVETFIRYRGTHIERTVVLPQVTFGSAKLQNVKVFVWPDALSPMKGFGGVIGMDLMQYVDMEFDIGLFRLNLFSPNHCDGQGLYWSRAAAVLPFEFDSENKVRFQMDLNGKPFGVGLAIRTGPAVMPMWAATEKLGLDANSPGMTPVAYGVHQYLFHTLSAGGISIGQPIVNLFDQRNSDRCDVKPPGSLLGWACSEPDLRLTLDLLTRLRLYFAVNEKKVYITGFNATRDDAPPPPK